MPNIRLFIFRKNLNVEPTAINCQTRAGVLVVNIFAKVFNGFLTLWRYETLKIWNLERWNLRNLKRLLLNRFNVEALEL